MKKYAILSALLLVVTSLTGIGMTSGNTEINIGVNNQVNTGVIVGNDCNKGNGKVIKQQRPVDLFEKIDIDGSFNVNIVGGQKAAVKVTAESNILALIRTEVRNNTLYVMTDGSFCTTHSLLVTITVPKVSSIVARSASEIVYNAGNFSNDSLLIDLADASEMVVSGKALRADIVLQDASDLDASQFEVQDVTIKTSGSSEAKIVVLGRLSAKASDASEVYYSGKPELLTNQALDASDIIAVDE